MRKIVIVAFLVWIVAASSGPILAWQRDSSADDVLQAVLTTLKDDPGAPHVDGQTDAPLITATLPDAVETWTSQDWSASGGFATTGYTADEWLARVRGTGSNPQQYEVVIARHDQRLIWIGTVGSDKTVRGFWRDPEQRALVAIEAALGIGKDWTRTPLIFDLREASQKGYRPSLVTVLYRQGPLQVLMWYDSVPKEDLRVLIQGTDNSTALFTLTDDNTLQLLNRVAPAGSAGMAAVKAVYVAAVPEELTAIRIFAVQANSCAYLEPAFMVGTEITLPIFQEQAIGAQDCTQYGFESHFFQMVMILSPDVAAATSIKVNGEDFPLQ
jgi:hypothetical protein